MLLLIAVNANGQNLVPNPSFEDTIQCPFSSGDIGDATGWGSLCGSPDLFNQCNQFDWGVPSNIFGYQQAASGNGYAGFISYSNIASNEREFPSCNLTTPLSIGTRYYVSFKVALSLESIANPTNCASNKIGLTFTTGSFICNSIITNNPPVFTDSIIVDSLNWTRIKGSFIADSAYTRLAIGNFFDDSNTDTTKFFNSWWSDFAYYYLDDVAVGTDSSYIYNYDYNTSINENSLKIGFDLYPNPVKNKLVVHNNINEPYTIIIYDILGQKIYHKSDIKSKLNIINTTHFTSGLLLIHIESNNQKYTYKHLKQ